MELKIKNYLIISIFILLIGISIQSKFIYAQDDEEGNNHVQEHKSYHLDLKDNDDTYKNNEHESNNNKDDDDFITKKIKLKSQIKNITKQIEVLNSSTTNYINNSFKYNYSLNNSNSFKSNISTQKNKTLNLLKDKLSQLEIQLKNLTLSQNQTNLNLSHKVNINTTITTNNNNSLNQSKINSNNINNNKLNNNSNFDFNLIFKNFLNSIIGIFN